MEYLHWEEKTLTDFSEKNITDMYDAGYVFTRIDKGVMHQTRSVRINLSQFELSSENRRILKKTDFLSIVTTKLPLATTETGAAHEYHWSIGKTAKDFYETKFGAGIMSAIKVKEMLTDSSKSNFNMLCAYSTNGTSIGHTIAYENSTLLHYSYPFYDLTLAGETPAPKDLGMGMMLRAIQYAKDTGKQYIYLGSLQRPSDTYKLQFGGLEWFDGGANGSGVWTNDIEKVKSILEK
ncbi:MAG: hypothetical protein RIT04_692 [Candidatus Parcubacteria bacterium]|jgi:arginyl-tRNA--protein-N-Asp/Glu arginylyltransferase